MPDTETAQPEVTYDQWKEAFHGNAGRRISEGVRRRAEAGEPVGRLPLGYVRRWNPVRASPVSPDPKTAGAIEKAFEWADKGEFSLREISQKLYEKGLKSSSGRPLSPSALWTILTNPFYAGLVHYKGEFTRGRHYPLVSRPCFLRVQENLKRRRRR